MSYGDTNMKKVDDDKWSVDKEGLWIIRCYTCLVIGLVLGTMIGKWWHLQ